MSTAATFPEMETNGTANPYSCVGVGTEYIHLLNITDPTNDSIIYAETGYAFDLRLLNQLFESLTLVITECEKRLAIKPDAYLKRTYRKWLKLDAWLTYSLDTGARQRELRSINKQGAQVGMKRSLLKDGWQYWHRGKNQTGVRKAFISEVGRKKLIKMWEVDGLPTNDFVFSTECESMRKMWNELKNEHLSGEFRESFPMPRKSVMKECQKYSLKSFRKTHASALFDYYWNRYDNPTMALERVQEALGHKTKAMTWQHYAREIERVGRGHYKNILPFGLIKLSKKEYGQSHLLNF